MCVLVTWLQQIPGYPLVVAANRDEMFARPAKKPFVWPAAQEGSQILAPRDEEAGGTWWAISEMGLFVAVTNRAGRPPDLGRRSRGLLVSDMAHLPDLAAARKEVEALKPELYNGFHLLVADLHGEAFLAVNDGAKHRVRSLEPGMQVVSERSFGAMEPNRDEEIRGIFQKLPKDHLAPMEIERALATHREDPWQSACIHQSDWPGYGTRSSSLLALSNEEMPGVLHNAEGRPCEAPFEDLSGMLAGFLRLQGEGRG